jgi:hypothetical protein
MTEEQKIKTLAVITLNNTSLLHGLVSGFRELAEKVYRQDGEAKLETLHALEQLEAACAQSKGAIELVRKEFGLV